MFLFLFVTLRTGFFGSRYAHENKKKQTKKKPDEPSTIITVQPI